MRYRSWQHQRDERYFAETAANGPAPRRPRPGEYPMLPYRAFRRRFRHWQHHRDEKEMALPAVNRARAPRPLLRERYWEARHWIWERWQDMPDWPIWMRVTAGVLPIVIIIGGALVAIRALKSPPVQANAFLQSLQDSKNSPAGAKRVLVIGDEMVWVLGVVGGETYVAPKVQGRAAGLFGCGIAEGDPVINGVTRPARTNCGGWENGYRSAELAYGPAVTVLMVGNGEAYDRIVAGKTLRNGTTELEQYLTTQLDKAIAALTTKNGKILLADLPCDAAQDAALGKRRHWVNQVWHRYVDTHRKTVGLAPFNDFACPGGERRIFAKEPIFGKTYGLTKPGATATWKWIAKITRDTLNT